MFGSRIANAKKSVDLLPVLHGLAPFLLDRTQHPELTMSLTRNHLDQTGKPARVMHTYLHPCSMLFALRDQSAISGREAFAMIMSLILGGLLGYTLTVKGVLPHAEEEIGRLYNEIHRISEEKAELHERLLEEVAASSYGLLSPMPRGRREVDHE